MDYRLVSNFTKHIVYSSLSPQRYNKQLQCNNALLGVHEIGFKAILSMHPPIPHPNWTISICIPLGKEVLILTGNWKLDSHIIIYMKGYRHQPTLR